MFITIKIIEFFGKNIEYDPDSISDIPLKKFKKLSYQIDAVNQGYELLLKHNGFFLADVVGTGKTVMAALLAKKFIINNGAKTKILIVYPPTLEKNWKSTFKEFRIDEKCDFITEKAVEGGQCLAKIILPEIQVPELKLSLCKKTMTLENSKINEE